jgi:hypothetical protein
MAIAVCRHQDHDNNAALQPTPIDPESCSLDDDLHQYIHTTTVARTIP